MTVRILLAEDNENLARMLGKFLSVQGHAVEYAASGTEALRMLAANPFDVLVLDLRLPEMNGIDLLQQVRKSPRLKDLPVIIMTGVFKGERYAEAARRLGVRHYLEKPFTFDRLDATLTATLELTALRREVRALRARSGGREAVVGSSPAMEEVLRLVERVAPAEGTTVLIQGETGTGKGLLARTLHRLSPRAQGPFINVTCSDLAESLMESELFGHEKGAFTDARSMKRGLLELADHGTLFLDEIGEVSTRLQAKLLRFMEDRTFRRVGGTRDMSVDVRVIAATNRELEQEVAAHRFREDLYYRLRVLPIRLPPLRERRSDIPALAKTFLDDFIREFGKKTRRIDADALELLQRYSWPGNVRELRNVIERSVLLGDGPVLTADMLPPELHGRGAEVGPAAVAMPAAGLDMETLERTLLLEALRRSEGNRSEAGRLLGLSRHQIRNRLKKFGVEA